MKALHAFGIDGLQDLLQCLHLLVLSLLPGWSKEVCLCNVMILCGLCRVNGVYELHSTFPTKFSGHGFPVRTYWGYTKLQEDPCVPPNTVTIDKLI